MAPLVNPLVALAELVVVVLFAVTAIEARALDKGGFLASIAVGYAIFLGGGWRWFVVIATFFIVGVGFTWFKYEFKKSIGTAQEKGGARNWPNILANGGVAAIFGLAEFFVGGSTYTILFVGAMAAAASDTVATELGLLSPSPPCLIMHLRRIVSPGTSGGVTVLGFTGAALGSLTVGVIAALVGIIAHEAPAIVVLTALAGGLVGATADSLAGALIQRKSVCVKCGRMTENAVHCDLPTLSQSGLRFVDNNVVNLLATIVGAGASVALVHLIFL